MHHCVGRMNYDIRFAQEESLIFFVRMKEQPDKPLVTLEYSLKTHRVLQCYASHNTKPTKTYCITSIKSGCRMPTKHSNKSPHRRKYMKNYLDAIYPYLNFNTIIPHLPKRRNGRSITSKATARATRTRLSLSSKWKATNASLSFWTISPPIRSEK